MNNISTTKITRKNLPLLLYSRINSVSQKAYPELYEQSKNSDYSLEAAENDILSAFQIIDDLFPLRYLWMTLILVGSTQQAFQYYQPHSKLLDEVIRYLGEHFETIGKTMYSSFDSVSYLDQSTLIVKPELSRMQLAKKTASLQIINDIENVYRNALQVPQSSDPCPILLDILDDCLEGYAIFPGAQGRRQLFDWWIYDVVPACYDFSLPSTHKLTEILGDESLVPDFSRLESIAASIQKVHSSSSQLSV